MYVFASVCGVNIFVCVCVVCMSGFVCVWHVYEWIYVCVNMSVCVSFQSLVAMFLITICQ